MSLQLLFLDAGNTLIKEIFKRLQLKENEPICIVMNKKEVHRALRHTSMLEDGIEWNALTRLPIEKILEIKPAIMAKNYIILPIPAVEFERNPTIGDQNPGYSKN